MGRAPLVVVDNYDSFTFNLVQLLARLARDEGAFGASIRVIRNDAVTAEELLASEPGALLLSPGPGLPRDAGVCERLVRLAPDTLPIFGVCLGMQIIAEALGGRVVRAPRTMHGRVSRVRHERRGCFAGLVGGELDVMRYHSWVVDAGSLPPELEATAWADDGCLMALRHRHRPLEAVQFHPESFLTEAGDALLRPFVRSALAPRP